MRLQHRVIVAGGLDATATLVHDWSRDTEWRDVISMTTDPPGPAVLGQQVLERLRFAGVVFVTPTVIDRVDDHPDGSRTIGFRGGGALLDVVGNRTLRAVDADHTEVTADLALTLRGPLRLLNRLLAPVYARQVRAEQRRLADLLR